VPIWATASILISTATGAHGPGVKYFLQPGLTQPSFSVTASDAPAVAANSLPVRVVRQMSPPVIDWVRHNKDAPLDSCHHGDTWTQPGVNDFIRKRRRV
jgi:hypothetical protein